MIPPTTTIKTYFAGYPNPITPISCPDNVAFDSTGSSLWVATDGQPSAIDYGRRPVQGRR